MPPVQPMLAKSVKGIPDPAKHGGLVFEPKWDGFRCIVFRDGDEVELASRNTKPLTRYFPEVVEAVKASLPERCVLDGEVFVAIGDRLEFERLQERIHPADSRVRMLAETTPAGFVAFDLLALGDESLSASRSNATNSGRGLLGQHPHPGVGRVDPLLQPLELEPVTDGHEDLAVEHAPLGQGRLHRLDDLGEVAGQRLGVAAGELDLVAVAEHDAAEAVPLGLEHQPAVLRRVGDALDGLGEHRLDRRHHGEIHGPIVGLRRADPPHRARPPGPRRSARRRARPAAAVRGRELRQLPTRPGAALAAAGRRRAARVLGDAGGAAPQAALRASKEPQGPGGLYLDGGYGVGKTHLLASLWHNAPGPKLFATFVELTHLVGALGFHDAVATLSSYTLVCVDEFELDDPGDTVLVSTLLTRLREAGVRSPPPRTRCRASSARAASPPRTSCARSRGSRRSSTRCASTARTTGTGGSPRRPTPRTSGRSGGWPRRTARRTTTSWTCPGTSPRCTRRSTARCSTGCAWSASRTCARSRTRPWRCGWWCWRTGCTTGTCRSSPAG